MLSQTGTKKVIYACCDVKPFVFNELYYDADILIIGLVSDDGMLKEGRALDDAPFKDDMFTLGELFGNQTYLQNQAHYHHPH